MRIDEYSSYSRVWETLVSPSNIVLVERSRLTHLRLASLECDVWFDNSNRKRTRVESLDDEDKEDHEGTMDEGRSAVGKRRNPPKKRMRHTECIPDDVCHMFRNVKCSRKTQIEEIEDEVDDEGNTFVTLTGHTARVFIHGRYEDEAILIRKLRTIFPTEVVLLKVTSPNR